MSVVFFWVDAKYGTHPRQPWDEKGRKIQEDIKVMPVEMADQDQNFWNKFEAIVATMDPVAVTPYEVFLERSPFEGQWGRRLPK